MSANNKIVSRKITAVVIPDLRRRVHQVCKGAVQSPTIVGTFGRKEMAVEECLRLAKSEGNRAWGGYWIRSPLKKEAK